MTTQDWIWFVVGEGVLVLTLWWAYKDQCIGIDGGFEFPRATRPIRFWLFTSICTVMAVGCPILYSLSFLGY
ncbi:hypothetical protein WG901_23140 [Novosphingobium sp. PS1R-30]|uniref:Uncharacterized protein n=1 Tax=Novosphingobium anseongense TaxID=3133436 RepID=A0ABU8S3V1_9SPHN